VTTILLEVDVCLSPRTTTWIYADTYSDIGGRFCSDECCLPCPLTELVYSDGEFIFTLTVQKQADVVSIKEFPTHERAAEWLSVVSLISSIFLLLTYAILAPEKSHRHYLSVGLIVSNVLLQVCAQLIDANHFEANTQSSWPLSFH
jgi:hypothetical protein